MKDKAIVIDDVFMDDIAHMLAQEGYTSFGYTHPDFAIREFERKRGVIGRMLNLGERIPPCNRDDIGVVVTDLDHPDGALRKPEEYLPERLEKLSRLQSLVPNARFIIFDSLYRLNPRLYGKQVSEVYPIFRAGNVFESNTVKQQRSEQFKLRFEQFKTYVDNLIGEYLINYERIPKGDQDNGGIEALMQAIPEIE